MITHIKTPMFFITLCFVLVTMTVSSQAQDLVSGFENASDEISVQTVLIAKQKAVLASPRTGEILELDLYNGDEFKEGDTLIRFRCDIDLARLRQSQARLDIASAQYEAQKKLRRLNSTSSIEFQIVEGQYKEAQAVVDERKGVIDTCEINAPFDGVITGRLVNPFETVEIGANLIEISSSENLQASLLLPSRSLQWLNKGDELSVDVYETGLKYSAQIIRIGGAIDEISQSVEVVAEVEDPNDELLPGMTGVAYFSRDIQ